jgi:acyl-CoA oxidase
LLPQRGGADPLNHALTYFHRVRVPAAALLGSLSKPRDVRLAFFASTFRVAVGTLATGGQGLSALQVATSVAAQYSKRRIVTNNDGQRQAIIVFRTHHTPIVTALAQAYVMKALHLVATQIFTNTEDPRVRHGMATILKVVMLNHAKHSLLELAERCGAQGTFEINQLTRMHVSVFLALISTFAHFQNRKLCKVSLFRRVTPSYCLFVSLPSG